VSAPTCNYCGGTGAGVEFPVFPMTPGEKFGTICVPCDEKGEAAVEANRYPGFTIDDDGLTAHYDLCKPCATEFDRKGLITGDEMECPPITIHDDYHCDGCDALIIF